MWISEPNKIYITVDGKMLHFDRQKKLYAENYLICYYLIITISYCIIISIIMTSIISIFSRKFTYLFVCLFVSRLIDWLLIEACAAWPSVKCKVKWALFLFQLYTGATVHSKMFLLGHGATYVEKLHTFKHWWYSG